MTERTLSNPAMEVNDVPRAYTPNSMEYKNGFGDKTVRTQSGGGDSITAVVSEDATTKKSMVKFKLATTANNIALANEWNDMPNGNTIRLSEGAIVEQFVGMILITEPTKSVGADGELELEFEGPPSL